MIEGLHRLNGLKIKTQDKNNVGTGLLVID